MRGLRRLKTPLTPAVICETRWEALLTEGWSALYVFQLKVTASIRQREAEKEESSLKKKKRVENPPRQKEQKCFKLKHKFLRISTLINRLTWAAKCHAVDWVNSRAAGCNHDVWFFSLSEGNMSRNSGSCWQKSSLTSPQRQSRRRNKKKRSFELVSHPPPGTI